MFPVSNAANQTATIMGGVILNIPETSTNKELAWELITTILKSNILSTRLVRYWVSSNTDTYRTRSLYLVSKSNNPILHRIDIDDSIWPQ